jgi:hypothetical protein
MLPDGTESDHFTGDSASATIIAHGTSSGLDSDRVRVGYTVLNPDIEDPDLSDPNCYLHLSDKEGYTTFDVFAIRPEASCNIKSAPEYNQADVVLLGDFRPEGVVGTIDWKLKLKYATSTGHGSGSKSKSATTNSGQESTLTYTSEGGLITGTIIGTANGIVTTEKTDCFFIFGTSIPNDDISERLNELYSGTTYGLLTGICWNESTYTQFNPDGLLYNIEGRWPLESGFDCTGEYIGLMQCGVTFSRAWDWKINTQAGADIWSSFLTGAYSYEARIIQEVNTQYSVNLRHLLGEEIEDEALTQYGGYTKHHYFQFNGDVNNPDWDKYDPIIDKNNDGEPDYPKRSEYISGIRSNINQH